MKDLRLAVRGLHDGDCVTGRLNVCCCGRVHFGIFILSSSTINATPKGSRTTGTYCTVLERHSKWDFIN